MATKTKFVLWKMTAQCEICSHTEEFGSTSILGVRKIAKEMGWKLRLLSSWRDDDAHEIDFDGVCPSCAREFHYD